MHRQPNAHCKAADSSNDDLLVIVTQNVLLTAFLGDFFHSLGASEPRARKPHPALIGINTESYLPSRFAWLTISPSNVYNGGHSGSIWSSSCGPRKGISWTKEHLCCTFQSRFRWCVGWIRICYCAASFCMRKKLVAGLVSWGLLDENVLWGLFSVSCHDQL